MTSNVAERLSTRRPSGRLGTMSNWHTTTERVTDDGWTVRVTTLPDHAYVRVTAISPERKRVLRLDKVDPERATTLNPAAEWRR